MTSPTELYREIPLTQGQVALVDASDYEWLMQWKWFALWNKTSRSFYAARNPKNIDGKRAHIRMNRLILGLEYGDPRMGDHRDGNTLNNLRFCGREKSPYRSICNTGISS